MDSDEERFTKTSNTSSCKGCKAAFMPGSTLPESLEMNTAYSDFCCAEVGDGTKQI